MRHVDPVLPLLFTALFAPPAVACLWDDDTLRDEKRGLPGVAEVLAGQWERHSRFFYEQRVIATKAKLVADPKDWAAMDNLAVAHEKLGDPDAAIVVMLDKDRRNPGQYTTYANLGTFYLHKGDFDRGIDFIRKALAINPDAHFGREKYQLQVAEYLRAAKQDPGVYDGGSFVVPLIAARPVAATLPASATSAATAPADVRAAQREWVDQLRRRPRPFRIAGTDEAVTGIVGMIRFGTGTSPDLFYALGDLLAVRGDKHLAYRAYKRALDLGHTRPEHVREAMAATRGGVEHGGGFADDMIAAERAAADAWVAAYQRFEDDLVRSGKDPQDEANVAPFYAAHGRTLASRDWAWGDYAPRAGDPRWIAAAVIVPLTGWWAWSAWLRRRRQAKAPAATVS